MSQKVQHLRRQFLSRGVALAGILPIAWATRVFAQGPECKQPVDMQKNPMIKGIGYVKKIDAKKHKNLVNADKSLKTCWNCALYTAAGNPAEPWKSKDGACTLLMGSAPACSVKAMGGCNSWNEKAETKGKKYQG